MSFEVGNLQPIVTAFLKYRKRGPPGGWPGRNIRPRLPVREGVPVRVPVPEPPRPRQPQQMFGNGTFTRARRQYGRRVSRKSSKYARILANATVQRHVYGLDDYSDYGTDEGSIKLDNYYSAATPLWRTPCHLWDVTAAPNNINGTIRNAQCGYELGFSDPSNTAEIRWLTKSGQLGQQNVGHAFSSVNNLPNNSSLLRGVKANFMFYCPTALPVRIKIALIQLTEKDYHPPKIPDGAFENVGQWQAPNILTIDTTSNNRANTAVASFWQQVVHSYVKNPICIANANQTKRYMKVLKSHSFILNPKESTDNSATTYHQYSFYHRFARRCKYNWQDQDRINMQDDSASEKVDAENKCCVEPNARMYLMVIADSGYTEEEPTSAKRPSYDVVIRTYHDDMGA